MTHAKYPHLLSTIFNKRRINSLVKTMSTINTYCERHCLSTIQESSLFSPYTILDRYNAFSFKLMSHKPISNADFWRIVALKKSISYRKAHSTTFHATSRCGNVLQVFESDSKICKSEFTEKTIRPCCKCLPTVSATKLCWRMPRETWIKNRSQNFSRIFKVEAFTTSTVHGKIGSSTIFNF